MKEKEKMIYKRVVRINESQLFITQAILLELLWLFRILVRPLYDTTDELSPSLAPLLHPCSTLLLD